MRRPESLDELAVWKHHATSGTRNSLVDYIDAERLADPVEEVSLWNPTEGQKKILREADEGEDDE